MSAETRKGLYVVKVDDNYTFMREQERYEQRSYDSEEKALAVCRRIVDEFLDRDC